MGKKHIVDMQKDGQDNTKAQYGYKFISYPINGFLYVIGFCWSVLYVCPPMNAILYDGLVQSEADYMIVLPTICAINGIVVMGTFFVIYLCAKWFNNLCKTHIKRKGSPFSLWFLNKLTTH